MRRPMLGLLRGMWRATSWLALLWGGLALLGMNPSTPVDYVLNLGSFPHDATLAAPQDATRRLVVLEHGLWRSAGSMWKLERALEDHGYEVLNRSYPSTAATIDEHAAQLATEVEAYIAATADPRPLALSFVGHSMGGLVIRRYLQREDARQASSVVFLATPQRGAVLCDLRKKWWIFRFLMGHKAACELSPSDRLFQGMRPLKCAFATVIGGKGDGRGWHLEIPGDDDGTVAVAEARMDGAADSILLPVGHTRLSFADGAIAQVIAFLTEGRFRHDRL